MCFSDNMAVVHAINSRSVKDHLLMRLLRALFFMEAHFGLSVKATHIAGITNTAADSLSPNNIEIYCASSLQADHLPSPLTVELLPLLLNLRAD